MLKLINRRKLKYIGHASRNQSTNLIRIAYQGKLEGRNCKERPAVSVIENVRKAIGLKLQEVGWKSQNRESWKDLSWILLLLRSTLKAEKTIGEVFINLIYQVLNYIHVLHKQYIIHCIQKCILTWGLLLFLVY